jgi:anaerobic C4-dicarboxylate transporter DcuA
LLGLLSGSGITLFDIMKISVPATLIGVLAGALYSLKAGKELSEDPEYLERLKNGLIDDRHTSISDIKDKGKARLSVIIFLATTLMIVLFGSIPTLRPTFDNVPLGMPYLIEILMLTAAALILILTRTDGNKAVQGSIFLAGMQAVVAIFGIAWMGDTFIKGNLAELTESIQGIVSQMPWIFGLALFVMSILLFSQAATIRAIAPLGIALGISPMMMIALFPAVNGYFFIPNYPTIVAAINFDRTGTTKIGKWILNHSFMLPGLITTITSIAAGLLFISF